MTYYDSESSNDFQEVIYQRALEFEMSSQGIDYLEAYDLNSKKNQGNPGIK